MRIRSNRTLIALAAVYGLSVLGDQLALVTLTLRLYADHQPGSVISLLVIAGVVPVVVLGPLVGPWVDRVESSRLIAAVALGQGVLATGLAFAGSVAVMLVLVALLGAGLAVVSPAVLLLIPAAAGDTDPARAFAQVETFRQTGAVVGPMLAGLLVSQIGSRAVLGIDAATFAVMAVTVTVLPAVRPGLLTRDRPSWARQVRDGVTVLARDRVIRTAVTALALAIVFTAVLVVAQVFFIRQDLHQSARVYGVLITVQVAGRLAASAFLASRIKPGHQGWALAVASMTMGLALILAGATRSLPVVVAAFGVVGAANIVQSLAIRNLVHTRVPAELRGRAFASTGAALNGANIAGTALGGPAVSAFGGAGALVFAGAGTALAALSAAPLLLRSARRAPVADTRTGFSAR